MESYLLNIYLLELTKVSFGWHGWALYLVVIAFVLAGSFLLPPLYAKVGDRLLGLREG